VSLGLALLLVFTAVGSQAQAQSGAPLVLGALGTALGFIAGGNAASAAIGGAAGVGAGILLDAPHAYAGPGYHRERAAYYAPSPVHYSPDYYERQPHGWNRGHYVNHGQWARDCDYPHRAWAPRQRHYDNYENGNYGYYNHGGALIRSRW